MPGAESRTLSHLLFPRRVVGTRFRQVSWLPDHRLKRAFPGFPSGTCTLLPGHSGGTAPDSHRLPY
jgi:hypothetical protein